MSARRVFLPWARRGIAAESPTVDTLASGVPGRATLPVTVHAHKVGETSTGTHLRPQLTLHGPGDVVGIESGQVVRMDPVPTSTGAEPTFFPSVEFAAPELPWAFTPAAADKSGRLRPWVCLVVVPAEFTIATGRPGHPPWMTVPAQELPDLSESWAWAHVQVTVDDGETASAVLRQRPESALSRLVCPRRLRPATAYRACVVPAFDAGRRAGLGEHPEGESELRPAWTEADDAVPLPVYHHWDFATGTAGDFESLARDLHYRPLPDRVGSREVDVTSLAHDLGIDPPEVATLPFRGALRPPRPGNDADVDDRVAPLRDALAKALNLSSGDGEDTARRVGPPVYGAWQASSPGNTGAPRWLWELNIDPRHRAAAAYGALIVRDRQDELATAAWKQAGQAEQANEVMRRSQLAREGGRAALRRLARLPADEAVAITAPMHTRLRISPETVSERIRHSPLPVAATTATFRRLVRPRGPFARRAGLRRPAGEDTNVTGGGSTLAGLATGTLRAAPSPRPPSSIETAPSTGPVEEPEEGHDDLLEEALTIDRTRLTRPSRVTAPEPPPALLLDTMRDTLLERLDPDRTVAGRALTQVTGGLPAADPLGETATTPRISEPLYRSLRELSEDVFLPGLERVPADTVTLLETNAAFIEAVLVGANHELSQELLWRGFPTDQRATYFRSFWTLGEDAEPGRSRRIDQWDRGLGENHPDAGGIDQLVLLLRGELLRRYPDATVYAARAEHPPGGGPPEPGEPELHPHLQGGLDPDIVFLAFDLPAERARSRPGDPGWFFVLQEPPAGARFGVDPAPGDEPDPRPPGSWNDLSWAHLVATASELATLRHVRLAGPLAGVDRDQATWAFNAAHMAQITLEGPTRVAIHADDLLPPPQDG